MILPLLLALAPAAAPAAPAPEAAATASLSTPTAMRLLGLVFPVDDVIAEHRRAHQAALAERFATNVMSDPDVQASQRAMMAEAMKDLPARVEAFARAAVGTEEKKP